MALNTKIIDKQTFPKMVNLLQKYPKLWEGDDNLINFYFYNKWGKLPIEYGIFPIGITRYLKIPPEKIQGKILHFMGLWEEDKPWDPKNKFYEEWKSNLNRAEKINLKKTQEVKNIETKTEKKFYKKFEFEFKFITLLLFRDYLEGKMGEIIKIFSPKLYHKLKDLKIK